MNLITLLLIVDRFITPMHLRKPGFAYSVSEPIKWYKSENNDKKLVTANMY